MLKLPVRAQEYITSVVFKTITDKDLDTNKLEPGTSEGNIYGFILDVEQGNTRNMLTEFDSIAKLSPALKEKTLSEAIRVLSNGSDMKDHFNYIPNRAQSLDALNARIQRDKLQSLLESGRNSVYHAQPAPNTKQQRSKFIFHIIARQKVRNQAWLKVLSWQQDKMKMLIQILFRKQIKHPVRLLVLLKPLISFKVTENTRVG